MTDTGASSPVASQPAAENPSPNRPVVQCLLRTDYTFGSECRQPALYRVYGGAECYVCCNLEGCASCHGHPVCADHAAKLRTESVAQVPARSGNSAPAFAVERIHSLAAVPA